MNPVVFSFGPLTVRAFTAWIALGCFACGAIVLFTVRRRGQPLMPWLDTLIGALFGGLIGARLVHVWLNWVYFAAHQSEILDFQAGGLDWHGALIGALLGGALVARLRRVPLVALFDALALGFPIMAMTFWRGCMDAACAYGLEVRTLADYPSWLVVESPDIYGDIAPRLNLIPIGIALAAFVLLIVLTLAWAKRLQGLRLWIALIVYGFGMALISFFRAEYVPIWLGRRADQVLDLGVMLVGAILYAVAVLTRRRPAPDLSGPQGAMS